MRGISGHQAMSLVSAVESGGSLLFCGPVGSGKTTLMAWLLKRLPYGAPVLALDQFRELSAERESRICPGERFGAERAEWGGMASLAGIDRLAALEPDETAAAAIRAMEAGVPVMATVHARDEGEALRLFASMAAAGGYGGAREAEDGIRASLRATISLGPSIGAIVRLYGKTGHGGPR